MILIVLYIVKQIWWNKHILSLYITYITRCRSDDATNLLPSPSIHITVQKEKSILSDIKTCCDEHYKYL